MRLCSLRIQGCIQAGVSHFPARGVSRRERRARPLWSTYRHFIGHLARQFLRSRRLAGLAHRRRHLRTRAARRCLWRRLGGGAGCRRRNLGWFDRHLHRHLDQFPNPIDAARAIAGHCLLHDCRSDNKTPAAMFLIGPREPGYWVGSGGSLARDGAMASPAAYCCGSCRFRRSRGHACRQCSRRAIRSATDARSPPRVARARSAPA
jgi:hypothetical protein